jgi:hypothetical protein
VLWRPENSILAPVETLKPPESNKDRFGPSMCTRPRAGKRILLDAPRERNAQWWAHGSGHIRPRHPLKPACQIARLHETPVASLGHSKRILEIRLGDIFAASVDGTFSAIFSSRGQGWLCYLFLLRRLGVDVRMCRSKA